LKFVIQLAVFVFAVLGAWITFVFGKNLADAKKVAEEIISQKVEARVDNLIKTEIQSLRQSIDREKAIIFTYVDYYLPSSTIEPKEVKLLKARGFRDVLFWNRHNPLKRLSGNVFVLDLQNYQDGSGQEFSKLSQDDKEKNVEKYINEILPRLQRNTVLVIYARGRFNAIENIPNDRYYVPANSVVTLIGWVADSAYVAYGQEVV
ncbi:MAG: hypothetical protein AAFR83_22535, partial [Cyanobacteria bacterium J06629_18]